MVHLAARIGAFFIGCIALYFALFMYESECGVWQSNIEELWIRVSDRTREVGSRTIAIFNTIAELDTRLLNRMYGPRMVSFRMVGVSTITSLILMFLTLLVLDSLAHSFHLPPASMDVSRLEWITIGILLALALPAFLTPSRAAVLLTLLPVSFFLGWWTMSILIHDREAGWSVEISSAILLSLASDIMVTTLIRKSIKALRKELRVSRVMFILLVQCLCIPVFVFLPGFGGFLIDKERERHAHMSVSVNFYAVALMNITTVFLSLWFISSLVFVVAGRLLWPVIERLLYPIADLKVIRNRKLMGGVALVCFAYAFHLTSGLLKSLMDVAAK